MHSANSRKRVEKTAFGVFLGQYEYEYLPFGVQGAPMFFNEQIRPVLEGIPNVILFIDDILIASSTLGHHFRDIEDVFFTFETL